MPKRTKVDELMDKLKITRTAANNAFRKRGTATEEEQEKGTKRKAIYHVGGQKL